MDDYFGEIGNFLETEELYKQKSSTVKSIFRTLRGNHYIGSLLVSGIKKVES